VSPSTHHQALCALLYLYRQVLGVELPWMQSIGRPRQRERVPVVLSRDEVARLFAALPPDEPPLLRLLYGAGLRIMEGLRLRIKDLDFDRRVIVVRDGKGGKDRVVMLPASLHDALRTQVAHSRAVWAEDRAAGRAGVWLPQALEAKFPRAAGSWAWHWVSDVSTTMIYTHVLATSAAGLASPLDSLHCAEPSACYSVQYCIH
jgi:site-specific recombinase XerD